MSGSTTNDPSFRVRNEIVKAMPLLADCTVSEIRPGEWLALGSVHRPGVDIRPQSTILVGLGNSDAEALAQVERALRTSRL